MAGFTVSANGRVDSNPDVNELHARMTTKQAAPETPLPWQLDENRFIVRQHFTVADCGPEERHHINAAYIVHACNAYPRLEAERAELVAALHDLEAWCALATRGELAELSGPRKTARALLAKLGAE